MTKTKRKSVTSALVTGFKIPKDAVCIDISVRPMVLVEGLNGETVKRQFKTKFFNAKIYLENANVTVEDAKKLFGMKDKDMFMPVDSFVESSVFRFAGVKTLKVESENVNEQTTEEAYNPF